MNEAVFQELLKEAGAVLRGNKEPARTTVVQGPDVKKLREDVFNLTQQSFAVLVGISVKTLQNWEQNRRKPEGPARVLLGILERHPEVLLPKEATSRNHSVKYRVSRGSRRMKQSYTHRVKKAAKRQSKTFV